MPLQRRIPKRGFTNNFKKRYSIVNVADLARLEGVNEIDLQVLVESGLVKKFYDGVKLLGEGEITRPVVIHVHRASESAIKKVQDAGGRVELIPVPERN